MNAFWRHVVCLFFAIYAVNTHAQTQDIDRLPDKQPWENDPRVLSSERIPVTVVATVNRFQIIVFVDKPKGYLLLTAREPISMHFGYAQYIALEKSFLLYDKTGQRDVAFELVPPLGYQWQIPLKSVQPWVMPST
jgi:hypothetical protein